MHKPSASRLGILMNIAAAVGLMAVPEDMNNLSTARILNTRRGKPGKGKRWVDKNVYIPGGEHCNVDPTPIKNPKIAAHVNMMHDKWLAAKLAREAAHV